MTQRTATAGSVLLLVADHRLTQKYDLGGWLRLRVDDKWIGNDNDRSRIGTIVTELETAGWIKWVTGPDQTRTEHARLTASGEEVVNRAAQSASQRCWPSLVEVSR
jgi:hypothetical protein